MVSPCLVGKFWLANFRRTNPGIGETAEKFKVKDSLFAFANQG